jgi:hypothetical protein
MARSMIDANETLFRHLEVHCARRGEPIPSAGETRWVHGDAIAEDWLKNLSLQLTFQFGRRRSLIWCKHGGADFICLVGFEFDPELTMLLAIPANAGLSVCILAELQPLPVARSSDIRNIVEVGCQGEPGYVGHDCAAVEDLFPSIRTFSTLQPLDHEAAHRMFLMLCVDECRNGESWIGEPLAYELATLADLNVSHLPYDAVCRSIFDSDPRSLFLALYRCIEATYAYESCRRLVASLGLAQAWHELATALDDEVGWHPQHASSLNLVLQYAQTADLEAVCACLDAGDSADLCVRAGRAIYGLRNQIVHYRPELGGESLSDDDWNELGRRMVGIVFQIFSHAFV